MEISLHSNVRYKVLSFAVVFGCITYMDRVCISNLSGLIMKDLEISKVEMGWVFSAFTAAYALFEIPSGWWGDRIGTRKVLTRIVVWWSTFTIATAAAFNLVSLLLVRFFFGAGEAGAWPNAAKTLSRWFPVRERGKAQGIFFAGAHFGGAISPIIVTWMLTALSWRQIFIAFGLIGLVWAACWYWWYIDEPRNHPEVSESELRHILAERHPESSEHFNRKLLTQMLKNKSLLFLCLQYFTQSYGFYFFITWLPKYLEEARGFRGWMLGIFSGLPMLMSVFADLLGGLATDVLTRKYGLKAGRNGVAGGSLFCAGFLLIAGTMTANPVVAVILLSLALAAANFLLGAAWGTCVDISGSHTGVVSAVMNTSGQVGGVLCPIVAGFLVQNYGSWILPLVVTGTLYILGSVCWLFVEPARQIFLDESKFETEDANLD